MNPAQREQLLMCLLPSLIVVLGWWGWLRPAAEQKGFEKQLAAARAAAITPEAMFEQDIKLEKLRAEAKKLNDRQTTLVTDWDKLRSMEGVAAKRTRAIEDIAALFTSHGLSLIREEPAQIGGNKQVPTSFQKVLEKLDKSAIELVPDMKNTLKETKKPTGPEAAAVALEGASTLVTRRVSHANDATIWKLEFIGGYANVLAALNELRDSDCHAVPVGLTMKKTKTTTSLRQWTLLIRI